MSTENHYSLRKICLIALLGLFIGLLGLVLPEDPVIAFEVVINNTNLAPNVAGHPPGTGERISGNVYYANNSAIQLFVFSHANTAGQNGQIALSINDTEVLNTAIRPIGVAENTNTTLSAIIPKGAKYIVNFTNYHHYEWREYPILSGRNGTLSVNQSGGSGASSLSQLTIDTNKDWMNYSITNVSLPSDNLKVNKTGDTMNLSQTLIIYKNSTGSVLPLDFICAFGSCIPRYYSYTNTGNIGNYFVGIRYRGNLTSPQAVQESDSLFRIAGAGGFDTNGTASGSAIWIDLMAANNWNSTSKPGKMEIRTVPNNSINLATRLTLSAEGNLTVSNLAGTGNAYICVDSTGTLYRGNPGC